MMGRGKVITLKAMVIVFLSPIGYFFSFWAKVGSFRGEVDFLSPSFTEPLICGTDHNNDILV